MCEFVLPLTDTQATLEVAGGKGASLARLANAGLPVPGGFHVTTAAYRQFVAANDLQPRILAALEQADAAQPATLEAASPAIRDLFAQASMPPDVAGAIARAYAGSARRPACGRRALVGHCRGPARPLLCRSAGDLPQHSRRRGRAGRGQALLGLAVDGARHRLPGAARH